MFVVILNHAFFYIDLFMLRGPWCTDVRIQETCKNESTTYRIARGGCHLLVPHRYYLLFLLFFLRGTFSFSFSPTSFSFTPADESLSASPATVSLSRGRFLVEEVGDGTGLLDCPAVGSGSSIVIPVSVGLGLGFWEVDSAAAVILVGRGRGVGDGSESGITIRGSESTARNVFRVSGRICHEHHGGNRMSDYVRARSTRDFGVLVDDA